MLTGRPRTMKQRTADGFTLLEVLIALAIFGILFGGVFALVDQQNYAVKTAADLLRARLLGNELIETLKTQPFAELQSYSFTELSRLGNLAVDVQVSEFGGPTLKKVAVTVQWADARKRDRQVIFTTLRSAYPLTK
jgi:prepilin-type N-terminal cleavage/methylation domain-containing protein